MRFRRLALEAYGPFTGTVLDLSRTQGPGLHLIYGPNEAGKSSALRAIVDLLFGIPQVTPDAHLHPAPALRLSASIERDGEELSFVRRKKRKDSLSTADDQPLEEARLSRFLNGLDAGSFARLFGLDQERLQEGGEQTLSGQGDVGEALFDAGAAGRSVHRVKLSLVQEAEALFKDRAQKPELNRLLSLYSEQKKRAKDAVRSPEKYAEQQERVRETSREAEARRAALSGLRAEKEHLARLRNVLSSVLERDRKLAERSALGPLPSLRRDLGQRREQSLLTLSEAERDAARLTRQVAEQQAKLLRLPEPSAIASLSAEVVRELGTSAGAARKAQEDLPKRQAAAQTLREAIRADLTRLGLDSDLEGAAQPSLPVAEQARLQALAREFQGLALKLESAERDLTLAQAEALALDGSLAQARAARRIDRHSLLPSEALERFDAELTQAAALDEALNRQLQDVDRECATLAQQLELQKGQQGVPSEALLLQARTERDQRLREAQELAAEPRRKALELSLPLAALARATAHADSLADRLRSEADRVATAEALEQRLLGNARRRAELSEQQVAARACLQDVSARWERTRRAISSAELLPRELARLVAEEREGWLEIARQEQQHARAWAALASIEQRAGAARQALERWHQEWEQASAPLRLGPRSRPEQALAVLGALAELSRQRQELLAMERRVEGIQRVISEFGSEVKQLTEKLAPELAALPALEAARRLIDLYSAATDAARERRRVSSELERLQRELGEAHSRAELERQALAELCREAGVADAEALAELEAKAAQARALDAELERLDARLAEVGEGEDAVALADEARRSDKVAVAERLAELEDLIPAREEDWRELDREVERLKVGLGTYEGTEGAEAAQELSNNVARIAELSSAWVRRRLAAVVLERVVGNYRERHQGPILGRASELFSRLTLGRFSRLVVGIEEARLECVEAASGKGLELGELSSGTRFQLFLALKLASIEQYLRTAPPLPLVLDDVLVEWDDERAQVALSTLAEFSERVQILLFTHLARDVNAAQRLGDPRIFTHHLGQRGPGAALGLTVT